jgi:hypothetical protein
MCCPNVRLSSLSLSLSPPSPQKCQCIILCCTVILLALFYWLIWWCKSSVTSCYSAGQAHLCLRAHEGSLPCSYKLSIVFYCYPVESIPCLYILCVYHHFNFIPVFVCRSPKWSVFMRFSSQYFVCIYHPFVCLSLVQPSLLFCYFHWWPRLFLGPFSCSVYWKCAKRFSRLSLMLSEVIGVCLFVQFSFVSRSMWYVHSEVQHNEASFKKRAPSI